MGSEREVWGGGGEGAGVCGKRGRCKRLEGISQKGTEN